MLKRTIRSIRSSVTGSWKTFREVLPDVVSSIDFVIGVLAFAAALVAAILRDDLVARAGVEVALATTALGGGIVAVALTALAILAGLMTDVFAEALRRSEGGVRGAMMPYQVVAVLGGLGVIAGVGCIALGSLAPHWLLVLGFASILGLNVWIVVGTLQLVGVTTAIAIQRAKLYEGIDVARAESRRLQAERQSQVAGESKYMPG
jgi:hypothetical protein